MIPKRINDVTVVLNLKLKENKMLEVAAQIIICLILAALLGGIIGYLLGRAGCSKEQIQSNEERVNSHELHLDNNGITATAEASTLMSNNSAESTSTPTATTEAELKAEASVELEEAKSVGVQPILLTAPRNGKKDNLQLIKGVGKVLEGVLNEIGIYHFEQIANLTAEEVSWLDNSMSFPGRVEREEWVAQAKDLAEGVQTEFAQRVERGEVATSKKSDD